MKVNVSDQLGERKHGVDSWEDLKGEYIRVKDEGWGSTINEIGNLMEDKWLNFREFFSKEE